jgi:ABC-type transport system involved in multi-copper enzyme maturation permease subunit
LRDAAVVALFDLGTALRTRRALVAVALYALGAIITGAILVKIQAAIAEPLAMAQNAASLAADGDVPDLDRTLGFLLGGDTELARHLLKIPLVVLGFFWVTLSFLPFLVALVSHDIVNSEVRNRSARFVLLRTSRASLLLGKMLSHGALFLGVTVVSNLVLFVYAWIRVPGFEAGLAGIWLVKFWFFTIIYGYCWLALAALVSSLVDSGGLALAALVVVMGILGLIAMSESVGFLSPSYYKGGLWSPRWGTVLVSLGAFLGFGTLFLASAWVRVQRRDW